MPHRYNHAYSHLKGNREAPPGAEFSLLVVEAGGVPAVPVLLAPSVTDAARAVDENEDKDEVEGLGLGHTLLYAYCSASPSQSLIELSSNDVPFVYIQQVPEAYGELPEL